VIEYPTGEKSRGICKRCGLHRRFKNYERNRQPLASRNAKQAQTKQAQAKRKSPKSR
jgi:hypothetical protein